MHVPTLLSLRWCPAQVGMKISKKKKKKEKSLLSTQKGEKFRKALGIPNEINYLMFCNRAVFN